MTVHPQGTDDTNVIAGGEQGSSAASARPPVSWDVLSAGSPPSSRFDCVALDDDDPLAALRDRFHLPAGILYFAGNSLGALPKPAADFTDTLVRSEWGNGLVRSWNTAEWIDAPRRIGDKIATLIGARPGTVIVADSTTVNLYKLLVAALRARPDRTVVLTEEGNFPTDIYIAQGAVELLGGDRRVVVVPRPELVQHLDGSVAVLMLTHVDYGTGERHDMSAMTVAAHEAGALALWDLSHSAGAVPIDLTGCDADAAIGCGYKYLNGGPGAPAYLYVAERLSGELQSPIWGWMGHVRPFAFDLQYEAGQGIEGFLAGTPQMISMAALEAAIDVWLQVDTDLVWHKSRALSQMLIRLIEQRCGPFGASIASPQDAGVRGSHIAVRHEQAYRVMRALIDRGVIGDYRPPDLMRFALTPLYMRFVDVWDAVDLFVEILAGRLYEAPEYRERLKVT